MLKVFFTANDEIIIYTCENPLYTKLDCYFIFLPFHQNPTIKLKKVQVYYLYLQDCLLSLHWLRCKDIHCNFIEESKTMQIDVCIITVYHLVQLMHLHEAIDGSDVLMSSAC